MKFSITRAKDVWFPLGQTLEITTSILTREYVLLVNEKLSGSHFTGK